jgi:hypothetical protein
VLVVCDDCGRHVKSSATSCPFCGATMTDAAPLVLIARASRAAMIASAGAIAIAACSSHPAYGGCVAPASLTMHAPCGFVSVTSTCKSHIETSVDGTTAIATDLFEDCTITAVLGDGTTHAVDVVVGIGSNDQIHCAKSFTVVSPTSDPDFTSSTCH